MDVMQNKVPWAIQSLQMRMDMDKAYAASMRHAAQRFLPMTLDKSVDRDYRSVIQDRINTWRRLAEDAEKHYDVLAVALALALTSASQKHNPKNN
jgi:hypothetical protein